MLRQRRYFYYFLSSMSKQYEREKNTFTQCWFDVVPPSTTPAQHQTRIGWMRRFAENWLRLSTVISASSRLSCRHRSKIENRFKNNLPTGHTALLRRWINVVCPVGLWWGSAVAGFDPLHSIIYHTDMRHGRTRFHHVWLILDLISLLTEMRTVTSNI